MNAQDQVNDLKARITEQPTVQEQDEKEKVVRQAKRKVPDIFPKGQVDASSPGDEA